MDCILYIITKILALQYGDEQCVKHCDIMQRYHHTRLGDAESHTIVPILLNLPFCVRAI